MKELSLNNILQINQILIFSIIAAIVVVIILVLLIVMTKKNKKVKIDSTFMNKLIDDLGGVTNIVNASVEQARIKIQLVDFKKGNFESLKTYCQRGVFITGNTVKVLFKYESSAIASEINKLIK